MASLKNPASSDVVEMEPKNFIDKSTQTRSTGQGKSRKRNPETKDGKRKNPTTQIVVNNSCQQGEANGAQNNNEDGNEECDQNDREECDAEGNVVAEDEVEVDVGDDEDAEDQDEDGKGNINCFIERAFRLFSLHLIPP